MTGKPILFFLLTASLPFSVFAKGQTCPVKTSVEHPFRNHSAAGEFPTSYMNPSHNMQGCSTFLLKREDALLVGHNLDQPQEKMQPGMIVVNKRGIKKEARTWLDMTNNEKAGRRIRWSSKYGSITCNAMGREFPDGGMNEKGLVVCEMTLAGTEFVKGDGIPEIFMVQWIQYLLDTCKSLEEVIQIANNIALTGWQNAWHFFVADATGKAAVIEYLEGKPVIYTGDSLPIPVLCNIRYAQELKQIKAYRGFGGTKRISKSDSEPRFLFAAHMLKTDDSSKPATRYAFSILNRLDTCTRWSIVYDIANRRIEFRTSVARNIRSLSMSAFDFSCAAPAMAMDINSNSRGDVRAALKPCTTDMNRDFVKKDIDRISRMSPWLVQMLSSRGVTKEIFIDRLATYPESTKCISPVVPSYLKGYEKLYTHDPRAAAVQWFKDSKFGLFVHYALASLCTDGKAEYIRMTEEKGYDKANKELFKKFDARNFNPEEICSLAIAAKMKYVTFTTQHLGRMYMYNTKVSNFTSKLRR
jgi:choloylglycine hydrolase